MCKKLNENVFCWKLKATDLILPACFETELQQLGPMAVSVAVTAPLRLERQSLPMTATFCRSARATKQTEERNNESTVSLINGDLCWA